MTSRIKDLFANHKKVAFVIVAVLAASLAFAGYKLLRHPPRHKLAGSLQVNLRQPDFLLNSQELSRLPKDIADTPALTGLVDEQLVFHYEEDEARLSVEGALRRMAYEHNLDLSDRFLGALLAAPAEVGVWRGSKGRPEYFVAVIERGALAKLTETLTKIVSSDKQLKLAGKLSVSGDDVPVYALSYGGGRTLAFAGKGERLIVLSDPRLAFGENNKISDDAANILPNLLQGHHPWRDKLPVAKSAKHSIAISAAALTMDYARFVPALTALRFDHDGKGWSTAIQFDRKNYPAKPDFSAIWRAVPGNASLCVALPVHWPATGKPLQGLIGEDPALQQALAALDPVAAACWYPESRLATPLLVARANGKLPPQTAELLTKLAEKVWAEKSSKQSEAKSGVERHASTVASIHGRSSGSKDKEFQVLLARQGDLLFFSPDRNLVNAALSVAAKRAPAMGDEAGAASGVWLIYDPAKLGRLLRSDVEEVLPQDEEAFFRDIARTRLWPRLEAWGKRHAASVLAPGAVLADDFVKLEQKPLKKK